MINQDLKLNILTFSHPIQSLKCSFTLVKADGYYPVSIRNLPINIIELFTEVQLQNVEYAYTNFTADLKISKPIIVLFAESKRFSKHYYSFLIANYFTTVADAIKTNFVSDAEV